MNKLNKTFMNELMTTSVPQSVNDLTAQSFEELTQVTVTVTARLGDVTEDLVRHLTPAELVAQFDSIVFTAKERGYTRIGFGIGRIHQTFPLTAGDAVRIESLKDFAKEDLRIFYSNNVYDIFLLAGGTFSSSSAEVTLELRVPMSFNKAEHLTKRLELVERIRGFSLDLVEDVDNKPRFVFVETAR